ncbi:unnamed protein product [Phytophthora fragariaefolia]|uniref:Unnamed protein product n=1 Tax=Phytophthora fragariaefolia TaxID=1490495 RepID=A0A9W6YFC1_9STRA|nr:unnamed protein product [Phytophthora fragariaefolia]
MTRPNLAGRLHRWSLVLQEYEFQVEYRPGTTNVVADALSRAPASVRAATMSSTAATAGGTVTPSNVSMTNDNVTPASREAPRTESNDGTVGDEALLTNSNEAVHAVASVGERAVGSNAGTSTGPGVAGTGTPNRRRTKTVAMPAPRRSARIRAGTGRHAHGEAEKPHGNKDGSMTTETKRRPAVATTMAQVPGLGMSTGTTATVPVPIRKNPLTRTETMTVPTRPTDESLTGRTTPTGSPPKKTATSTSLTSHAAATENDGTTQNTAGGMGNKHDDTEETSPYDGTLQLCDDELITAQKNSKFVKRLIVADRYVIAAVEYVTRYVVASCVTQHTAESVATFLMQEVVLRFGAFRELLSDGAPEFVGKVIEELVELLQAHQVNPVPYRPQLVGLVERFHRTWKDCVATFMQDERQADWNSWVKFAVYSYNSALHSTVALSQNELMMGRRLWSPNELLRRTEVAEAGELPVYHAQLLQALEKSHACAKRARRREKERQARYYNRKTRNRREFHSGDLVWMYNPPRGKQETKFVHQWMGPLRILESAGYDNYVLKREEWVGKTQTLIAHVSFFVTYHYPEALLAQVGFDIDDQLEDEDRQPTRNESEIPTPVLAVMTLTLWPPGDPNQWATDDGELWLDERSSRRPRWTSVVEYERLHRANRVVETRALKKTCKEPGALKLDALVDAAERSTGGIEVGGSVAPEPNGPVGQHDRLHGIPARSAIVSPGTDHSRPSASLQKAVGEQDELTSRFAG